MYSPLGFVFVFRTLGQTGANESALKFNFLLTESLSFAVQVFGDVKKLQPSTADNKILEILLDVFNAAMTKVSA